MTFGTSQLLRKVALRIAPLALLSATGLHAQQWAQPYGDYGHAMRHHQHDEERELKEHQREERRYYGNSWELRQHQREERQELKQHQRYERGYDNFNGYYGNGYYGRDGYPSRGWYDGRRY